MEKWRQGLAGFMLKGLIICVSFAAVFIVTFWLNQKYLQQAAQTLIVVTAKKDLLPGEPLTADMLQLAEKPVFGISRGDYMTETEKLLSQGPWYIGAIGFGAGDILYPSRLTLAAQAGGAWQWEWKQQDHARLVAVETTLVRSSGDWLYPGTVADAVVYIPARESYEDPQPAQVIGPQDDPLLSGLLVIDKKSANGLALDGQDTQDGYSRDHLPAVVTLMIDEDDIERVKALIRYNEEGKIYFTPTKGQ